MNSNRRIRASWQRSEAPAASTCNTTRNQPTVHQRLTAAAATSQSGSKLSYLRPVLGKRVKTARPQARSFQQPDEIKGLR